MEGKTLGTAGTGRSKTRLDGGDDGSVVGDETVGHAGSVEGKARIAVAVEEDEAAGGASAFGEEMDGLAGDEIGAGETARNVGGGVHAGFGAAEEIDGGFGEDHFHDGFAVAGAGDAAGFGVGVAAAANERGIADAAGKFATGAAGGSGGEEITIRVEGDGADGSLFVATVMLGGVRVFFALLPGGPLGFAHQFFRLTEVDSLFFREALRAIGDEHHVRTIFEDFAGDLNGVLYALQAGSGACAKRCAVHDDGVAFDAAVKIEMRAVTGVEDGIVLEDHDGGFDGVESGTAARKNGPAGSEGAMAAGFARVDGIVRNVPGAAMNNESRFHHKSIAEKKENGN